MTWQLDLKDAMDLKKSSIFTDKCLSALEEHMAELQMNPLKHTWRMTGHASLSSTMSLWCNSTVILIDYVTLEAFLAGME